jgi:hypothetical protein
VPDACNKDLLQLANLRFSPITAFETLMLRDSQNGDDAPEIDEVFAKPEFEPNDAEKWGNDRQVRSSLIHWLCTDHDVIKHVDARGIQICGAKLMHPLDLYYAKIPFPITMWRCRMMAHLICYSQACQSWTFREAGSVFFRRIGLG